MAMHHKKGSGNSKKIALYKYTIRETVANNFTTDVYTEFKLLKLIFLKI